MSKSLTTSLLATLALIVSADLALAQSVVGELLVEPQVFRGKTIHERPTNAPSSAGNPIHRFGASRPSTSRPLRSLMAHNRSGSPPPQNGFSRALPTPARLRLDTVLAGARGAAARVEANQSGTLASLADGSRIWSGTVAVEAAWRLRLRLDVRRLPDVAKLWVRSESGWISKGFGIELMGPDGRLWTPSVPGPSIELLVEVPAGADDLELSIGAVAELFELDATGQPMTSEAPPVDDACVADAQCFSVADFSAIEETRKAIALITFQVGNGSYICSGGLLNDTDVGTAIPYFLTANHCFDTANSAASVEAYWDYTSDACDGAAPSLGSVPRSSGSTLLVSSSSNDYTLVELNSIPAGRWLLGWNAGTVAHGTVLNRISHPQGVKQSFSQSTATTTAGMCGTLPRPDFLYSTPTVGGTLGGSSGSPVVLDNGQVVGQLYGACGPNPSDGCDYSNSDVDGALSEYWDAVSPWLDPSPSCTYTVTQPNGGESWETGTDQLIHWSATGNDCGDTIRIDLYRGGLLDRTITAATLNDGTRRWNIPADLPAGSDLRIRVTDGDNAAYFDDSDDDFTVFQLLSCSYDVTRPDGGEAWETGTDQLVHWSSAGNDCGDTVRIDLYRAGIFDSSITAATLNDGTRRWNIPADLPTGGDLRIRVTDGGNSGYFDQSGADFFVSEPEPPPPVILKDGFEQP